MLIKPIHFDRFKCIAHRCPDTCCAGWEIDVDADTADFYASLEGDSGKFVREKLIYTPEGSKLCLEGERCRFLRDDNLCELILRLGDGALCDICREHPRFYTECGNLTAAGMGICCPEAARLWLCESCELVFEDDGYAPSEQEKLAVERLAKIIEHTVYGEGTLGERLCGFMPDGPTSDRVYGELLRTYRDLEVMDRQFPARFSDSAVTVSERRYVNLAAYFIFRYYFSLGEEMTIKFTAASLIMIAAMGGELEISSKDYSKEVEYDTDNVGRICELLDGLEGLPDITRRTLVCR